MPANKSKIHRYRSALTEHYLLYAVTCKRMRNLFRDSITYRDSYQGKKCPHDFFPLKQVCASLRSNLDLNGLNRCFFELEHPPLDRTVEHLTRVTQKKIAETL